MDTLEVEIFPDSLVPPVYQIYDGLYDLYMAGRLRIVLSSRQPVPGDKHSLFIVVRDKVTNKERKLCFDMGDGCRILPMQRLEACDIFFKRSYLESLYQSIPEPQRKKIVPFGLNWGSMLKCGFVSKSRLALASFRMGRVSPDYANRLNLAKELSKLFTSSSTFAFIDKYPYLSSDAFEAGANEPASPRIIFQTRAWDHRYD